MTDTDKRIAEITARANAATEGPWEWSQCYELDTLHWSLESPASKEVRSVIDYTLVLVHDRPESMTHNPANANPNWQFIAHAREDIPYLLARLAEAEAILAKLPKTADGVPIAMGMNLFAVVDVHPHTGLPGIVECGFVAMICDGDFLGGTVREGDGEEYDVGFDDCYSTNAAALAAKETT